MHNLKGGMKSQSTRHFLTKLVQAMPFQPVRDIWIQDIIIIIVYNSFASGHI